MAFKMDSEGPRHIHECPECKPTGVEGLERCPQCYLVPEPKVADDGSVTFECPRHGHMAMGDTLETAVQHWNKYIAWIIFNRKATPEPERWPR